MTTKTIDPWTWQQKFGFSHGVEYMGNRRIVEVSGQCAISPDGTAMHPNDMRAQIEAAVSNIDTVLKQAGMGLGNIVRIRVFVTDVEQALAHWDAVVGRLNTAGSRPASTLLGISALSSSQLMVEIDATAAG